MKSSHGSENPLYLGGVVAQTFYVGAQIMCWTFIIQYAQENSAWIKLPRKTTISARWSSSFPAVSFAPSSSNTSAPRLLHARLRRHGGNLGTIYLEGMSASCLMAISACMSSCFPPSTVSPSTASARCENRLRGLILAIVGGAHAAPKAVSWIWRPAYHRRARFLLPSLSLLRVIAGYVTFTMQRHAQYKMIQ